MSWLHHQGLACVSCVSPTLFQPVGSGSHLYPANRNTLRSGHGVEGLTDSRGSFPLGLPCPRLLYPYCITTWEICQGVFLSFFKKLFEVPNCGWRLTLSPRTTMGLPHISWVRSYLPLTLLIIADNSQKSTWQIAQNRDFYFPKLCATFRLTNCWRCVIMEISRPASVGAPLKMPLIVN